MNKVCIIAEIGINHNGNLDIAKKLIRVAKEAGCNLVKFQKRTVDLVYTKEELDKPRESPWGTTNREQKNGLEFGEKEYDAIDKYCKKLGIGWFASAWDVESQLFLRQYNLKYNKIASAMLTDKRFLEMVAEEGKYTFVSTGGSTLEHVEKAVRLFDKKCFPIELLHCNSTYPMDIKDANLNMIPRLKELFGWGVGFSDHSTGLPLSVAAVALGATSIERHITLDRSMYGSDQAASLEPAGIKKLVQYVRAVEEAMGDGIKIVTEKEKEVMKKLRKVDTL